MGKRRGQKFAKGKSKKDTWKKLQHPDLEEFLKGQREDERFGASEKSDDQLFMIDQDGSDILLRGDDGGRQQKKTGRRAKTGSSDGPLVDLAGLKCFEILKPHSAVKDPLIKRNRTKLPGEKKSKQMLIKDEIRRSKRVTVQAADSTTSEPEIVDPWSAPDPKSVESVLTNEWLSDDAKRNLLRNRSVHKVKKPPTQLKAIEAPHPGLSVNPSFADHQDILKKVVELTNQEILKEQKLIRKTSVPKSAIDEVDADVKDEAEVKSEPESDEDSKSGLLQPKAKTRQQKRKARELNDQQREHKMQKQRNKLESDIFRVKSLTKEINKAEKAAKTRLAVKIEKKVHREKYGQLELSKHKFVPEKPNPLLSEEMKGSLLSDAQNGIAGLTMDRFKSLQKRNLIEPRVKQRREKKYKRKRYQRPSERMEWEKTGMWNGEKLLNPGDRRRRPPPPRRR